MFTLSTSKPIRPDKSNMKSGMSQWIYHFNPSPSYRKVLSICCIPTALSISSPWSISLLTPS